MSEQSEKPKTGAARQQTYHQKMRERGLTRLSAWVPENETARAEFWAAMTELEKKWAKRGLPTVAT